jgi:hypothetical protein
MVLQLFRKEIYLPFLLSISLFLIIDISFYNHIALGKNGDDNNRDSKDNNVREEEKQDGDDNNRDSKDNNVREEEEEEDEKEEENEVPFILPFNAVPFP